MTVDPFNEYAAALDELVALPNTLQAELQRIGAAERSACAALDQSAQQAELQVEQSRRLVATKLKDARDVLSAIDQSSKVPGSVRPSSTTTGPSSGRRASLDAAVAAVRQAVIDEQRARRDAETRARSDAARQAEQRRNEERRRQEQAEQARLEAERLARRKALQLKVAAISLAIVALLVVVLLFIL